MRAVNNYAFLVCACGLKIKIPPDFKQDKITCPRCGCQLDVPSRDLKSSAVIIGTVTAAQKAQQKPDSTQTENHIEKPFYVRKGKGWESLSCPCGNLIQISPSFSGNYVVCPRCGRKIEVRNA